MVKLNDLSKVENAIKAVINNKLKHNSDDTLLEKLFSLLKSQLTLGLNEKQSIIGLMETSIESSILEYNERQTETNLLAKIRICGSLLSDDQLFQSDLKCLNYIKILSNTIINGNNSSLKFAYFKCLNDISCHSSGCNWILSTCLENSSLIKSFPHLLLLFVNRSESRFVEQEVRQLLIRLLNDSLKELSESVGTHLKNFEEVFQQILCPLKPLSVEIIREILLSTDLKREFIIKYDIINILINNIDIWVKDFAEKVYQLCETLGLCIDSNEKIFSVIEKLLQKNQLKPLIGLLTHLISLDNSFSNKWFTYTMGSFIGSINSDLQIQLDLSTNDRTFLERFSNNDINNYSLKQILKVDFNGFDSKQMKLIFKVLLNHINSNHMNRGMRKTIVQTLSVIEKLSLNSLKDNDIIEELFAVYCELLIVLSNDFKLIVLKSLRIIIESKEWPQTYNYQTSAINNIIHELNNNLIKGTIDDNNWELIDSVLEVIYCVSASHNEILFTSVCPELLISIFSIWTTNKDNLCSTLRSTLISILMIVYLKESKEDLEKMCVRNECDLQWLLSFLFNDELIVRNNIIKTLNDNISLLLKIETQNTLLFDNIIQTLCKVSITELDDELQCNVLDLLHNILVLLIDKKDFSYLITLFLKSGFFHILYYIINSDHILYKVKITSVKIVDLLRDKMVLLYGRNVSTTLESIIPQNIPLMSSSREEDTNIFSLNQIKDLNNQTVINFLLSCDTNTITMRGNEDSPNLSVLDDILSVSLIDSDILIDCY